MYYKFIQALSTKNETLFMDLLSKPHPKMLASEKRHLVEVCTKTASPNLLQAVCQRFPIEEVWGSSMAYDILLDLSKNQTIMWEYATSALKKPHVVCPNGDLFSHVLLEEMSHRLPEFHESDRLLLTMVSDPVCIQHAQRISLSLLSCLHAIWDIPEYAKPKLKKQTWQILLDTLKPKEMLHLLRAIELGKMTFSQSIRTQILSETVQAISVKDGVWWKDMLQQLPQDEQVGGAFVEWKSLVEKKELEMHLGIDPTSPTFKPRKI